MTASAEPLPRRTAWARNLAAPLRAFVDTEISGAIVLLVGAVAALAWVNSPWGSSYDSFWATELSFRVGGSGFDGDLHALVNDGLMAIFFFVVGLEVRRELDAGELRDRRRVGVPVLAALGGMALPIAIYLAFTVGGPADHAWGMVMPTDTAFALGLLALVGRRSPQRVRVFVLTLVIADDVGALLVIAFAYTDELSLAPLVLAGVLFAVLLGLHRVGILTRAPHILLALAIWAATAKSGVHPTIAGVVVGLSVPGRLPLREDLERATAVTRLFREQPTAERARSAWLQVRSAVSPNERLQYALHPWSSFAIVPVFALANAGVRVDVELLARAAGSPITLGVAAALVLGKLVGISVATIVAAHPRLGRLPLTVELPPVFGAAAVAGIGFTLSLFIAELALEGDELEEAKIGILGAGVAAAVLALALFRVLEHLPRSALERAGLTTAEPLMDLAVPVDPARDRIRGDPTARVTLLEYGDHECPYCAEAADAVRELLAEFDGELRYVWRHLPLNDVHPHAQLAAEAAEAADAQGSFWSMHDLLLANRDDLEPYDLGRYARRLGLDLERFWSELRSREHADRIAADVESADASGVTGTPTFFLDGRRHEGAHDAETLAAAVRAALGAGSPAGGG